MKIGEEKLGNIRWVAEWLSEVRADGWAVYEAEVFNCPFDAADHATKYTFNEDTAWVITQQYQLVDFGVAEWTEVMRVEAWEVSLHHTV